MTTTNLANNRLNLLKKLQSLYSEKTGIKKIRFRHQRL